MKLVVIYANMKRNFRFSQVAVTALLFTLIATFQNCGEGFKPQISSSEPFSSSSPAPDPNPTPAPLPMPTPTPPAPYNLQNLWQAVSATGAPEARIKHKALWTGTQMLIFGGQSYTSNLPTSVTTGGVYTKSDNTWKPMATSPFPVPQFGHSAIWTGSRMIVFGGSNFDIFGPQYKASPALYDPATNTWMPASTVGAPSARSGHSAVWTGSRMLIWGGTNSSSFQDGYIYDPSTNAWTGMNMVGAPAARSGHVAIWTGQKMIVYGGGNATTAFNDGGIYDLASNTWTAMSTVGAPSARTEPVAVWTGTKMVVFGGCDGAPKNDGAIFDPATNTWSAMDTVNAPNGGCDLSAAWTGVKMVVLGSVSSATDAGSVSGGVYDPVANSWSLMNKVGAPTFRIGPSLVFADNGLIAFGGSRTVSIGGGTVLQTLFDGGIFY